MTRILSLTAVFALIVSTTDAQVKTGFVHKTFKADDGDYKYAVFVPPSYDGSKAFPVILFLHGSGETGTDGDKQTKGGLGKHIRDVKQKFNFITVFPQAHPTAKGWGPNNNNGKAALGMLDEVMSSYKTDSKRVYLTGLSMGGFGTWSFAAAYPDKWAAIAPICGGGNPKNADKIKDIPCWDFHGDADDAVNVSKSRDMIKALKDAGGNPKYTEYPGVGHNSWDKAYATGELYSWMLKHSTK